MNKTHTTLILSGKTFYVDNYIIKESKYLSDINTRNNSDIDDYTHVRDGIIHIKRSETSFEEVVKYMKDDNYPIDLKYKNELDFYGVKYKTSNKKIIFNLRGTKIVTNVDSIKKSKYLMELVSKQPDSDGSYFIDRCPVLFDQVLNYMKIMQDDKYINELKFYCNNDE